MLHRRKPDCSDPVIATFALGVYRIAVDVVELDSCQRL